MGKLSKMFSRPETFPGRSDGRRMWREVFGRTSKEDGMHAPSNPVRPSNGFARSLTTEASFKRLLTAMRSLAPGGWSDDRYEQSKHFVGIQYECIRAKCEQLAQSQFKVYEKDDSHPDGKKVVTRGHPGYQLVELLENPNRDDSFGDLMYKINQQMDLTGTGLLWMVPNALGQPMELYPIPTATAIPQPAINPDFPDGYYRIQPLYPYGPFSSYPTPNSAVGAPIPAQWMMRFQYPHPLLRYDGWSPLTALRLHIDEVESIDRSRWYSMKRSLNPSAVLNMDDMEGAEPFDFAEIERIRAEWEAEFQGPENHGRLIVGTPGGRLDPWGSMPKDMDYQGGWEQLVSFVMAGFGITKSAAGMIEDSSYATLFATLKQLHLLTLEPQCRRIASKLTKQLAPFFGDNLLIEIKCQRIDDHDVRNAKLGLAMQAKAITINEFRKEMDMPILQEPWGSLPAGTDPMLVGVMPQGLMTAGMPGMMPMMVPSGVEQPGSPGMSSVPTGMTPQGMPQDEAALLQESAQGGMAPGPSPDQEGSLGPRKQLDRLMLFKNLRGKYHRNGANGRMKHA